MGKKFDDYLKSQNKEKEEPEKKKTNTAEATADSGTQNKFYSRFVKNNTEALPVQNNDGTLQDRKQRIQDIVSQSGAALRNGALRPQGYSEYRQEIDDLIKSGATGELVQAKKDEYTQFKTDMYNRQQARRKQLLLNKAEKDPDFNQMVELGRNRFDTLNQEKNRKGFRISFSPRNGGNDLAEYTQRNYKLNTFNEDERNTYLYLLGKEGWKAADEYEKLIQRDVNARTAPKEYEFMRDFSKEHKAGAAALYPAMGFFGGAALGDTVRQGLRNAGRKDGEFVPADNNSAMYFSPRNRAAIMEGITDGMNERQKFLAQTGLSALDFATTAAVGGGLASGLGMGAQASQAATLGLMGANAGGATSYEAIERGATPGQAAALGLASAAAEIAFEKIPVGHFMRMTNGEITSALGKEILKQAAEEGMEELGTEYVNWIADNQIMGNKSEMNSYITELMAQGVKANDAKKAAVMEFAVKRPAMAFLGGAVSGAGIGAAGAGVGRINLMTNPVMGDMVKAVQESTGLSKAKAWGVVIQAMQGNDANAENNPESAGMAENIPALPESVEQNEEAQGNNADWREDIISAVMDDNNMSYEDAEQAVDQAQNAIVPTAEQKEKAQNIANAIINLLDNDQFRYVSLEEAAESIGYDIGYNGQDISEEDTLNIMDAVLNERPDLDAFRYVGGSLFFGRKADVEGYLEDYREMLYGDAINDDMEQNEKNEDRVWTRAAREQAEYDAEYERTHPQTLPEIGDEAQRQAYEDRLERTQKGVREIEAQEEAEQERARLNAVVQKAVNKFNEKFKRVRFSTNLAGEKWNGEEAFRRWAENEINEKGIPEGFRDAPEQYADYLVWNVEQQANEKYKQVYKKGYTREMTMRKALRAVLEEFERGEAGTGARAAEEEQQKIPRAEDYLRENPEGGEQFVKDNYGRGETGLWGNEVLRNAEEREIREKLGQEYEGAKRRTQRAADELKSQDKKRSSVTGEDFLSPIERDTVEKLVTRIFDVPGGWNASTREAILNAVLMQIKRGEPLVEFSNGQTIPIPQNIKKEVLLTMVPLYVEHDALKAQYMDKAGDLKTVAKVQAARMAEYMDEAEDYKVPLAYYLQDPKRVFEGIFKKRPDIAKKFNDTYTKEYADNNSDMNRMANTVKDRIRKLNIDTGKKKTFALSFQDKNGNVYQGDYNESAILQIYGENLIDDQKLDLLKDKQGNKIDADKIRHARDVIRTEYQKLLKSINNILVEYGYTPSMEITDYFPHYNESAVKGWEAVLNKIGLNMHADELPTPIAGRTENWRPGKQWFGNILERQGDQTTYDAIGGFDKYLNVAGNIIYHTGDVQKLRELGEAVRNRYSDALYSDEMRDLKESRIRRHITPDQYNERAGQAREDSHERMTKMNNFVQWVDEQANIQAGKQTRFDRSLETFFGRKALKRSEEIVKRAGRNMVNGNVSASLTNIIPIVQDETGAKYKLKGLIDTIREGLTRDDFVDRSTFLTNRYGTKPLVQTKLDSFVDKAGFLMESIDHITAESLVRARYMQNMAEDMNEEDAMAEADDHVARVMADRTKGLTPAVFNVKNPAVKLFTQFQVEMLNQYEHAFKDVPRQYKQKYGDKFIAYLTAYYFKTLLACFIYNEVTEKITHRRAATDPIDMAWEAINNTMGKQRNNLIDVFLRDAELYEDKNISAKDAESETLKRIVGEVPIIGSVLGGRIPLKDAFPSPKAIRDASWKAKEDPEAEEYSKAKIWKEWQKPIAYFAAPTAGLQAKKTIEGLLEVNAGGSYVKNTKGEDVLRYPVENDSWDDYLKGAVFGRTASEGYKDWKRGGFKNLSAKETQRYDEIVRAGIGYETLMQTKYALNQQSNKADRARALYEAKNLTAKQKDLLWDVLTSYKGKDVPDFNMRRNEFYEVWKAGDEK